jgi:DNA-binding transcriptional regulator YiaG
MKGDRAHGKKDASMNAKSEGFSAVVKEVRKQLELSQEGLARELGVSFATVNRWENGKTAPSKLARARFDAYCEKTTRRGRLKLTEGRR